MFPSVTVVPPLPWVPPLAWRTKHTLTDINKHTNANVLRHTYCSYALHPDNLVNVMDSGPRQLLFVEQVQYSLYLYSLSS